MEQLLAVGLIQPAFMFMVGVALPWSVANRQSRGQTFGPLFGHALWRAMLLVLLAVFSSQSGTGNKVQLPARQAAIRRRRIIPAARRNGGSGKETGRCNAAYAIKHYLKTGSNRAI